MTAPCRLRLLCAARASHSRPRRAAYSTPHPRRTIDLLERQHAKHKAQAEQIENTFKHQPFDPQFESRFQEEATSSLQRAQQMEKDDEQDFETEEQEIADMIANKLGPDTTVEDVYAQYPEVGDAIEQEIADMDWKKDI